MAAAVDMATVSADITDTAVTATRTSLRIITGSPRITAGAAVRTGEAGVTTELERTARTQRKLPDPHVREFCLVAAR